MMMDSVISTNTYQRVMDRQTYDIAAVQVSPSEKQRYADAR